MIESLKLTVRLLEDHLNSFSHETSSEAFIHLQNEIYRLKAKIRQIKSENTTEGVRILKEMNNIVEKIDILWKK